MSGISEILRKPYGRVIVPETDGSFRAEIVEFPGCIATADTAAQALVVLEEVAESWLESMIANGNPIPEPMETLEFSGKLVLRLPKSLHARAAYAAKRDEVSLNQFIVSCVSEHIGARSVVGNPANAGGFVFNISNGTGPNMPYGKLIFGEGVKSIGTGGNVYQPTIWSQTPPQRQRA